MKKSTSIRKSVKLIAVLLTLATLIVSLPLTVFAQQNELVEQITQELPVLAPNDVPEQLDYEELVEQGYIQRLYDEEQDLYSYLFGNEDGTKTRIYYQYPVKYIDENGKIRDKSLQLISQVVNGVEQYVSTDHDISVTFHNSLMQGVELAYNDLSLSMIPEMKSLSLLPMSATLSDDGKNVRYRLDESTYIDYSLTYSGIKEDIVVTEYTGRTSYSFILNTGGLSVIPNEYDQYVLVDNNGEVQADLGDVLIFTADERNNTFGSMQVEELKRNSLYRLVIELNPDWLADEKTVYPITIDPTISITANSTTNGSIEDCVIGTSTTYGGTAKSLYVGRGSSGARIRSVMRFPNVNVQGKIVLAASVEIRDLMCESEATQIECREFIGNSWSETNAPTWSNVGSTFAGKLLDAKFVCYGNGNVLDQIHRYSFDITTLAKDWAAGTSNPSSGIIFKAVDSFENGNTNTFKTFASINRSSNQPSLSITYCDPVGLNPSFEYDTQTLSDNVTIYNNIQFGGLVAEIKFDIPEGRFPLPISYIYNSAYNNQEFFDYYGNAADLYGLYGKGWKLSFIELLRKNGPGYLYIDGYGTEYYLTYQGKDSSGNEQYTLDEIGAKLTVTPGSSAVLELDDGIIRHFNTFGCLEKIEADDKEYNYNYNSYKLSSITVEGETILSIVATESFSGFTYPVVVMGNGGETQYNNGVYVSNSSDYKIVCDANAAVNSVNITHTETGFNVYNSSDGYGYRYSLSNGKVTGYEYYRKVGNTEYQISTTTITRNSDRISYTNDGIMKTYLLNAYDQLYNVIVSSADGKTVYDAQMYSYEELPDQEASYTRGNAHNLLSSTFSEFEDNWFENCSTSTAKALMGSESVVLTSTDGSKKSVWQSLYLSEGSYVISAYIQYSDLQKVNSQFAGGFYINVLNSSNTIVSNGEYYLKSISDSEDEWVRVWIPCTIGTAGTYTVSFNLENAIGTVYLDCFQLESGSIPSAYNCVKNADFESSGDWNLNYTQVASDSMFGDYVALAGTSSYQDLYLDNMPNKRSFIVSGWLYCTGGGADNYKILIRLKNTNNYVIELPFEDVEGLQYISYEITFPSTCQTLGEMEIILGGSAESSATVAYFDNILFTFGSPIEETSAPSEYSTGLSFISYGDGTCYLSGIGTCSNNIIVVPSTSPDGETVIKVGSSAFQNNTSITSITLPDTVESVRYDAFENCTSLTEVNLGNGLKTLEKRAFKGCTALTNIELPDTLEYIGSSCFYQTSLTSIVIPDSVTTLGGECFHYCSDLEDVVLSNSLTSIEYSMFRDCDSLQSIVIPEKVTQLGNYAFLNCMSLRSVQLPKSLTTMEQSVFYNVSSDITFYCDFKEEHWSEITFGRSAVPTSCEKEFNAELMGNFAYIYTYDGANIVGTTVKYIADIKNTEDGETTSNQNALMFTSVSYDSMGNLISYTDESGNTTTYTYDRYGNVLTVTDATNITTTYTYYSNGLLESVSRAGQTNTYTYTNGLLTGVTHIGTGYSQSYSYIYNNYGNLVTVKVGSQTLVTYTYENGGKGNLLSITYANGDVKSYAYDIFGNMTEVRMNGALQASYLYDYNGNLYLYTEVATDEITRYLEDEYGYAGYAHTYNSDDREEVAAVVQPSVEISIETEVDVYDRVTGKVLKAGDAEIFTQEYTYASNGYYSSYEIQSEAFEGGSAFTYTYNDLGYLTSVKENGTIKLRYTYDNLGQLIREDNAYSSKTYVYTYDGGGNILMKETYTYTTGTLGTLQSRYNYGYGNSNWKDQLTSYNGTTITYDLSGNPLNWRNASAMNWTGRQLDSMTLMNGTTLSFLYNSDGLRVSKTVGNNTVKYRWDGTTLLAEEHTNYTITFLYDGDTLIGFNYGGNNYFYGIDNLGVIHYVYNETGTVVVTYTYDAWGNTISVSGDSSLINVNPIRYKSYYYDSETGLFYLQSRYYDPVVGRFVNADDVKYVNVDLEETLINLYTYCDNNPTNYDDPSGHYSKLVGVGLQVGFTINLGSINVSAGVEIIWFWSSTVVTSQKRYLPFVYFYAEGAFDFKSLKKAINLKYKKLKFNAKNLFAKPSFSASVSVFFVWAKKKVVTPLDYTRYFSGAGVAGLGYRGYSAWSSSYSVIGAGKYWGNGSGIVLSKSYYWLLLGEGSIFASLYNAVKSKAEKEI